MTCARLINVPFKQQCQYQEPIPTLSQFFPLVASFSFGSVTRLQRSNECNIIKLSPSNPNSVTFIILAVMLRCQWRRKRGSTIVDCLCSSTWSLGRFSFLANGWDSSRFWSFIIRWLWLILFSPAALLPHPGHVVPDARKHFWRTWAAWGERK